MNSEILEKLKEAIAVKVKDHVPGLESFKNYRVSTVRSVNIEDRWFNDLDNRTVYSGNHFTIKIIMGNLSIEYITPEGAKRHSPDVSPSFAISGLSARYNLDEETFEDLSWEKFH